MDKLVTSFTRVDAKQYPRFGTYVRSSFGFPPRSRCPKEFVSLRPSWHAPNWSVQRLQTVRMAVTISQITPTAALTASTPYWLKCRNPHSHPLRTFAVNSLTHPVNLSNLSSQFNPPVCQHYATSEILKLSLVPESVSKMRWQFKTLALNLQ